MTGWEKFKEFFTWDAQEVKDNKSLQKAQVQEIKVIEDLLTSRNLELRHIPLELVSRDKNYKLNFQWGFDGGEYELRVALTFIDRQIWSAEYSTSINRQVEKVASVISVISKKLNKHQMSIKEYQDKMHQLKEKHPLGCYEEFNPCQITVNETEVRAIRTAINMEVILCIQDYSTEFVPKPDGVTEELEKEWFGFTTKEHTCSHIFIKGIDIDRGIERQISYEWDTQVNSRFFPAESKERLEKFIKVSLQTMALDVEEEVKANVHVDSLLEGVVGRKHEKKVISLASGNSSYALNAAYEDNDATPSSNEYPGQDTDKDIFRDQIIDQVDVK